jgi:RNA polymerase sigma factor (sigma-70 family)
MPSPSLTLLRTQTDDRLVTLARDGHERAFEAIVERYRRPLLRAARRVLPEARAEDALQQALIAAWTAMQRGDDVRDLRAWLYRIVHNTALNQLRVSGYDYDELEDTLRIADAGDDELERRAVVRQTLTSLAALPDRQREALLRTAVSGYSQEEVARDLGISDNAMRQLVHRARLTMRAAATAITPLPLVTAAASGSRGGPLMDRIAELAAGAAPTGAAVTFAKAGTAVVLATGALTGPAIVHRVADRPQRDATAAAATVAPASRVERSAAGGPAEVADITAPGVVPRGGRVAHRAPSRRSGGRHRRSSDDSSGRRSGRDDDSGSGSGSGGDDSSGSGSGGSSGSGEDSSGHGGGSGSSGSGSDDSTSGHSGSGDSGSGASGSDDSASGGSGSGDSGSGDSGSGASGSGSDDSGSGGSGSGDSGSGSGGSGADDGGGLIPPLPTPTPVATPESHGGHGSDDDGS